MLQTPLTKLLKIPHPILQGGMAWVATWELAAAVSNAGSLGIIGAGSAPASFVREQITQLRRATDKPFGVNVPLFNSFADEVIAVCIEERISVMTTGAGNPVPYIEPLKSAGIIVIPVVASTALARRLERSGADALIAEGEESGGHIGTVSTLALVPQVVDTVSIPVIASGGVGSLQDLVDGVKEGHASAVLAASIFHFGTFTIPQAKAYLHDHGVAVRMAVLNALLAGGPEVRA